MVTGRPPFVGGDTTVVISQHINTPPVAPSWHTEHCPPSLESLILSMLQKDASERPESADTVLRALDEVDPTENSARHSDSDANPLEGLAQGVFVGRESQLGQMRSAFDEAFAGRGSVLMHVCEPGIGKTRTTQELEAYARMRGARVLWGRSHEASGAPAYYPWKQVGDNHARFAAPDSLADDLGKERMNELGRILSSLESAETTTGLEEASAQFRLFDAYTSFLRLGAGRAPLFIVLDDLHWADQPSLQLLQHLARELQRLRILVVGTYRDTDLSRTHPLSETLAALNREGIFKRVVLRGLSRSEVADYIRGTTSAEPPTELVQRIFEETRGQPVLPFRGREPHGSTCSPTGIGMRWSRRGCECPTAPGQGLQLNRWWRISEATMNGHSGLLRSPMRLRQGTSEAWVGEGGHGHSSMPAEKRRRASRQKQPWSPCRRRTESFSHMRTQRTWQTGRSLG